MTRHFTHALLVLCLFAAIGTQQAAAQQAAAHKLSVQLRQLLMSGGRKSESARHGGTAAHGDKTVCAFVRTASEADTTRLAQDGCRVLASLGDISVATVPLSRVAALSMRPYVERIEAQRGSSVTLDTLGAPLGMPAVAAAQGLPQAYDGSGVVIGVQDVGFDLTHPTFRTDGTDQWRIRRFWDQLSADTIGSTMPVGAQYADEAAMRRVAHSRDAHLIGHGTHTAGIAAGTGAGTPYRGMAPGSDICMVSNAVNVDAPLISDDDLYKYTYATDVLGFKYIFDYAESRHMPCVINFSEGSPQDFRGDDQLYFEALGRLTGPGRIIVSSAGNNANERTYYRKPQGQESSGTFIRQWGDKPIRFTLKSKQPFSLHIVGYGAVRDTLDIDTRTVLGSPDSTLSLTLRHAGHDIAVEVEGYKSCYDETDIVYDVKLSGGSDIGAGADALSVETVGTGADIEFYKVAGYMMSGSLNPKLDAGDNTHCINSPAAAPSVICVGMTAYRTQFDNVLGNRVVFDCGTGGHINLYSSLGPTYALLAKPDLVAPGTNVISASSSYFADDRATNPQTWRVADLYCDGRTYGWEANSGTSMSSPAVAGIIALWLQAVPTLSPEDIMHMAAKTCTHTDASLTYPNNTYGYGEINAYRGLLYLLGLDSIDDISHTPTRAHVSIGDDGTVNIRCDTPVVKPFCIKVYSAAGVLLHTASCEAGTQETTLHVGTLPHGVYAIQIDGGDKHLCGSTLIRH